MEQSEVVSTLATRLGALEAKMEDLSNNGAVGQSDQIRQIMADVPDVFEVKTREGEEISLSLHHPTFYKLELIAAEVRVVQKAIEALGDLAEVSITQFVLRLLADLTVRNRFYKIMQIAFDPLPDPDPSDLSIPIEHIKLLSPTEVFDSLIKKSTPFFFQVLQLAQANQ